MNCRRLLMQEAFIRVGGLVCLTVCKSQDAKLTREAVIIPASFSRLDEKFSRHSFRHSSSIVFENLNEYFYVKRRRASSLFRTWFKIQGPIPSVVNWPVKYVLCYLRKVQLLIQIWNFYFTFELTHTTRVKNQFRRESRREPCIRSDPRLLARLFGAKSLGKSLTESLAKSLTKSLGEGLGKTLGETLGETLVETFRARESRQESCQESRIGSYAWLSARLSPRLVFLRG